MAASVATGSYPLRVKATSGSLTQTANFSLTVQLSGSSITLTVEDPMGSFNAAAYQVGTGSWQTLSMTGTTTKTGTFNLGSETKYGVAVRCGNQVQVLQATSTELANPKGVCGGPPPSTVSFTVNVSINGIMVNDGDKVCVNSSVPSESSNPPPPCSSSLSAGATSATVSVPLAPGTRDLLVTLTDGFGLVRVAKVVRNVNVTSGGNTSVSLGGSDQQDPVSFTGPTAPSGYTLSFPGAVVLYLSANGTAMGIVNASLTSYRPVSGFGGGDLYIAVITANNSPTNSAALMSFQFFNSGAPTLAFATPWGTGSLSVTQTAHPTVTGLTRSDADLRGYAISLTKPGQFFYTAILSKGWLGSANSYALPDLSSLLGYTPLSNGTAASFQVTALLSNEAVLWFDPTNLSVFAAGNYIRLAEASTTITVGSSGDVNFP